VLSHITATSAGRIVYIACDPASLGRDTGLLSGAGWRLVSVVGLDMFPMTHHTETVAAFER
jgi:tRNA/tmRNA/rRNA uracil-C5-methylase (TrmA/RlmC/RlmD family)